jgi:hypothetical protein
MIGTGPSHEVDKFAENGRCRSERVSPPEALRSARSSGWASLPGSGTGHPLHGTGGHRGQFQGKWSLAT